MMLLFRETYCVCLQRFLGGWCGRRGGRVGRRRGGGVRDITTLGASAGGNTLGAIGATQGAL
jgi:hypothetical protein